MEFILFYAALSAVTLSCQLICYANYIRKSGACEPSLEAGVAVDMG